MKKIKKITGMACMLGAFALTSCLTVNAKKIVEAPYVPEAQTESEAVVVEKLAYVYFSEEDVPDIDGSFDEWKNLEGVHSRQMVYGGSFNSKNADGFFETRTDGKNLYVFADVTDDDAGTNSYEAGQAWRGDGVEFFFGTDTSKHTFFKNGDVRVRLIPRSRTEKFNVGIGLNDEEIQNPDIKACVVYNQNGYTIEACFPLSVLGSSSLKNGQKLRMDFQVNDADGGKERTGLLHWNSPEDNTYSNPASWGNGKVVPLPVAE